MQLTRTAPKLNQRRKHFNSNNIYLRKEPAQPTLIRCRNSRVSPTSLSRRSTKNTSRHSNPVLLVLQSLIRALNLPTYSKASLIRSILTLISLSRARTHRQRAAPDSTHRSKQPPLKTWISHIRSPVSQRKQRQSSLKAGKEK